MRMDRPERLRLLSGDLLELFLDLFELQVPDMLLFCDFSLKCLNGLLVSDDLFIVGPSESVDLFVEFGDFEVFFVEDLIEALSLVWLERSDDGCHWGVGKGVVRWVGFEPFDWAGAEGHLVLSISEYFNIKIEINAKA